MKARLSILLVAAVAALGIAACSGGESGGGGPTATLPTPTPPPPPVTPPPPAAPPADNRVEKPFNSDANFDIVDDSFIDEDGDHDQEAEAFVDPGDTVTWTQNGQNIHRVEFNQVPPGAQSPDSRDLRPGRTWEFRPTVPGKYIFFCRYHEYMMDVVITVNEG